MTAPEKRRAGRWLSTSQIAKLLGGDWDADSVRRILKREGIGRKVGHRYMVTRTALRAAIPDLAVEIEVSAAEGLD
jgi:CO dehydrogenase/acetyl-CoA synthase gamma subunit (corrinoid Fe-S protein)